MPLDEKTKQRILKEETEKFLDPNFGQLDLSDYPDYSKPLPEESFYDEKYSMPDMSGTGLAAKQLHAFLDNPDAESLEIAAEQTGNPDLVAHVNEERAARVAEQFIRKHPEYYGTDENFELLAAQIAEDAGMLGEIDLTKLYASGFFTLEWLEKAYRKLTREGQLEQAPGTLRELSPAQVQYCQYLCSRKDTPAAIVHYVWYRLHPSPEAKDISESLGGADEAYALIKDPQYKPLLTEACWFVFEQITPDYLETKERREFIEKYTRNKFVTVPLLVKAWDIRKAWEQGEAKHSLLFGRNNEPESSEDFNFDSMSDEKINSLRNRTL